jgi:hypothetical protein
MKKSSENPQHQEEKREENNKSEVELKEYFETLADFRSQSKTTTFYQDLQDAVSSSSSSSKNTRESSQYLSQTADEKIITSPSGVTLPNNKAKKLAETDLEKERK